MSGFGPAPDRALDDAEHERPDAEGREHGAHRVEADVLGSTGCRARRRAMATKVSAATAAVAKKIDCHENVPSIHPAASMPSVPPAPAKPAQMPDRAGPLLGGEHARDGREGAGHDQRAAEAGEGPEGDELRRRSRRTPTASEPAPNSTMPTSRAPRRP